MKQKPTAASIQYEIISKNPYRFTSDDVRASPLSERYGWGVHSDNEGRIALIAIESDEYSKLAEDKHLKQLKAMRSKRK